MLVTSTLCSEIYALQARWATPAMGEAVGTSVLAAAAAPEPGVVSAAVALLPAATSMRLVLPRVFCEKRLLYLTTFLMAL